MRYTGGEGGGIPDISDESASTSSEQLPMESKLRSMRRYFGCTQRERGREEDTRLIERREFLFLFYTFFQFIKYTCT